MLIQSILFFILGIASIAFFLTLLSPLMWRRAIFLAKRSLRSGGGLSNQDIEIKQKFLKAQHAVELARAEERYAFLERISDERKIKLDATKEQLEKLHKLEQQIKTMAQHIMYCEAALQQEQAKVEILRKEQSKNNSSLQDCLMSEKSIRIDIAAYEEKLHLLKKKIESIIELSPRQGTDAVAQNSPSEATLQTIEYQQKLQALRQELTDFTQDFTNEINHDQQTNLQTQTNPSLHKGSYREKTKTSNTHALSQQLNLASQ